MTPATLCAALHLKDLRRMSNLREDTLGQVLSNAIVLAGRRVLVADGGAMGVVTAGCVRRMGTRDYVKGGGTQGGGVPGG